MGGLAVGEKKEEMLKFLKQLIIYQKPRYLMGVYPQIFWEL